MDHDSIVQALVAIEDKVVSTVECSWLGAFKILALLEHANWDTQTRTATTETEEKNQEKDLIDIQDQDENNDVVGLPNKNRKDYERQQQQQQHSPDSREFVILVMDGRAPILSPDNLEVVHLIPIIGNSFNCDIENGPDDTEFCVKISTSLTEPLIYVNLARGHRSQNFIDEVFRAAQIASITEAETFPWLSYYETLKNNSSHPFNYGHVGGGNGNAQADIERSSNNIGDSSSTHGDIADSDFELLDDEDEYKTVGVGRESLARGMTSLKGRDRDTAIKCVLDSKQDQYIDLVGYKVYIATWNVNGQSPGSICLKEWLARTPEPPDFYAVGFQELDLSKEAFLFSDSPKEAEWLRSVRSSLHPGAQYKKVKLVRLVGMMLIVFAKENLAKQLKNVMGEWVGTGILGKLGNKGGVAVRFEFEETSICFVNCHLAAHVEEFQRRNQDYQQISSRLAFILPQGFKYIKDHDHIYWFGDMNYRIYPQFMDADLAKRYIEAEKYSKVLEKDQLKDQMKTGGVFINFTEGSINFRPTYKYDPGSDNWDSSEKNRSPAWCDRILWKGNHMKQVDYVSFQAYRLSDHKPVASNFLSDIKIINSVKYRRVYEEALKKMDKRENEFLPQVTVDIPGSDLAPHSNRNEIHFGRVKFMDPVRKTFTVANTGQVPVGMEFIKKLDDMNICKDWLRIEPTSSFIQPGETCEIELQVLVDKRSAGYLNIGKDTMYDILVLHLESGKDIFVTVIGEFERSVFGCSISALVNLTDPISAISPGKLIELEKGQLPMGTYDIPKELWFLVDRLWRSGLEKESLFSQSGLTEEILQIRDWLDTIPNSPIPGSIDSIAEALLLLLESFPEPVIPYSLHLKCMDAASSYTSCKQILKNLPLAHRNVFVYICSFLRELLTKSEKNGLEPKLLALLFARVMLREQNYNSKPNQKVDHKSTFVYQFLVNEDYGEEL